MAGKCRWEYKLSALKDTKKCPTVQRGLFFLVRETCGRYWCQARSQSPRSPTLATSPALSGMRRRTLIKLAIGKQLRRVVSFLPRSMSLSTPLPTRIGRPPLHPPRVAIGRPADPNCEPHPSQTQTEAQNYKLYSLALPELIQIHRERGKRPKRQDNLSGEDKSQ